MMLRIRICEESFVEPIVSGVIRCPVHLYSGQEAIAVGVCAALSRRDRVFGTHRSHGHYLAKGGSLRALVAEVYCRASGCSRGRGGSMHIIAPEQGMLGAVPIVGGTIALAVGSALASRTRRDRGVTVSFFGDGAAGEGVLHEALNFAALHKLPMIFACENNLYSTHMGLRECRAGDAIWTMARPFGVDGQRVDGNDVLAVHKVARRAVAACRAGRGPVFVEFMTYRLRGHVGPDDAIQGTHTDIRPAAEVAKWRRKDPIRRFADYLVRSGVATASDLERWRLAAEREVCAAHEFARRSPLPAMEELEDHVFAP
ncbi:MAG: thiamine pyrophosphate-dependent dehydrogenase E1 component subunit alpha [Deltaproteobacteria bacterium]|nr:thiamine pyrophosphate-dependent dehydrogenase E1 component subunit alpha [Deltaproteobacteria bacterium]